MAKRLNTAYIFSEDNSKEIVSAKFVVENNIKNSRCTNCNKLLYIVDGKLVHPIGNNCKFSEPLNYVIERDVTVGKLFKKRTKLENPTKRGLLYTTILGEYTYFYKKSVIPGYYYLVDIQKSKDISNDIETVGNLFLLGGMLDYLNRLPVKIAVPKLALMVANENNGVSLDKKSMPMVDTVSYITKILGISKSDVRRYL